MHHNAAFPANVGGGLFGKPTKLITSKPGAGCTAFDFTGLAMVRQHRE